MAGAGCRVISCTWGIAAAAATAGRTTSSGSESEEGGSGATAGEHAHQPAKNKERRYQEINWQDAAGSTGLVAGCCEQ